jgi:hypothetical protein
MATFTCKIQDGDNVIHAEFRHFTGSELTHLYPIRELEDLAYRAFLAACQHPMYRAKTRVYADDPVHGLTRGTLHPDFIFGFLQQRLPFAKVSIQNEQEVEVSFNVATALTELHA